MGGISSKATNTNSIISSVSLANDKYQLSSDVKGWYPNLLDTHHPKFIYLER